MEETASLIPIVRLKQRNGAIAYLQPQALQLYGAQGGSISDYYIELNAMASGSTIIDGGQITTGSVTQTSKAESKKNFEKLENVLDIVKDIDIYKYNLKSEEDGTKKRIGFVIGNGFKYSEVLTTPDNEGVDAYSVASACLQAIKEQQEEIEALQKEIKSLKGE